MSKTREVPPPCFISPLELHTGPGSDQHGCGVLSLWRKPLGKGSFVDPEVGGEETEAGPRVEKYWVLSQRGESVSRFPPPPPFRA